MLPKELSVHGIAHPADLQYCSPTTNECLPASDWSLTRLGKLQQLLNELQVPAAVISYSRKLRASNRLFDILVGSSGRRIDSFNQPNLATQLKAAVEQMVASESTSLKLTCELEAAEVGQQRWTLHLSKQHLGGRRGLLVQLTPDETFNPFTGPSQRLIQQQDWLEGTEHSSPGFDSLLTQALRGEHARTEPGSSTEKEHGPSPADELAAILDAVSEGVLRVDSEGVVHTSNSAARAMFGYPQDELAGRPFAKLLADPLQAACMEELLREDVPTSQRREMVGRRLNGHCFPLEAAVNRPNGSSWRIVVLRDLTEHKAMQRDMSEAGTIGQQRLGRELHDHTGQELTGLGLLAHELRDELLRRNDPAAALASRIVDGIDQTFAGVQRLARGMFPSEVAERDLPCALAGLAESLNALPGKTCTFECDSGLSLTHKGAGTHLFRIAQESVSNAIRHGGAKNIVIRLQQSDFLTTLSIEDDGVGISMKTVNSGAGIGIMRHRAAVMGGILQVIALQPYGTLVACTLPTECLV